VLADDTSISVALAAMRAGAHDCVGKAIDGPSLVSLMGELARRHGKTRVMTRECLDADTVEAPAQTAAPQIPDMSDLVLPMWRQEQRIIEDAIQRFAGNIAMAAAALELSPSTIYRKRQAWAEVDEKRTA
jgi:transcriptional regulator with GAF, ATPase, and Fis domain